MSGDGSIYMFHRVDSNKSRDVFHSVIFLNKTLIQKTIIKRKLNTESYVIISSQISHSGNHLLVSYVHIQYHKDEPYGTFCETFFVESFNRGNDWTKPLRLSKVNCGYSSILLEKDTE